MPSLAEYPATSKVTMLVAADSGAGKTGGLASLVDAGYTMRVLDLEGKLKPLVEHVKKRDLLSNVDFKTFSDKYKIAGKSVITSDAPSFQGAMGMLNQWEEFGPIDQWPRDWILVIDSLSRLGRASLNMVLAANGNPARVEIQHYGTAMENIERLLGNITSPTLVPCHVIVLTHLTLAESETGVEKIYPEALGSKLNPKVGRYFDNMISIDAKSSGGRVYKTLSNGRFLCKTAKPIKPEYPIESGMADIFRDLLA